MNRRRKQPPAKRPPSADDEWAKYRNTMLAKQMANWLKQTINVQRPIQSLTMDELTRFAADMAGSHIVLLSRRIVDQPETETAIEAKGLLF